MVSVDAPTERPTPRVVAEALKGRVTRSRNVPWIVIGVLLVVGSSLTFAVWASGLSGREGAVALRRAVKAGAVLRADDLTIAQVGTDAGVPLVPASERSALVGRVALADLPEGALLVPQLLGDGPRIAPGEAVVGMALPAGAVPIETLHAGSPVLAVEVSAPGEAPAVAASDPLVAWPGTVFAVSTTDDPAAAGSVVVSLLVDHADAPAVAAAAAADRIRLVLVHSLDDVAALIATAATAAPPSGDAVEG